MKDSRTLNIIYNGTVRENPLFRLVLGLCPSLAVTTTVESGLGMGLATSVALILSSVSVSVLRKIIPDKVRIPALILIIATFVTLLEMVMQAYLPNLYSSLGVFLALIVVNCLLFARAETFASVNNPIYSALDGLAMGTGFTLGLLIVSAVRELFGRGTIFGVTILGSWFPAFGILTIPAGGFLVLGLLMAAFNAIYNKFSGQGGAAKK